MGRKDIIKTSEKQRSAGREGETENHRDRPWEKQAETQKETETDVEWRQPGVGADRLYDLGGPLTYDVTLFCPDLGHLCLVHQTGLQLMP